MSIARSGRCDDLIHRGSPAGYGRVMAARIVPLMALSPGPVLVERLCPLPPERGAQSGIQLDLMELFSTWQHLPATERLFAGGAIQNRSRLSSQIKHISDPKKRKKERKEKKRKEKKET